MYDTTFKDVFTIAVVLTLKRDLNVELTLKLFSDAMPGNFVNAVDPD